MLQKLSWNYGEELHSIIYMRVKLILLKTFAKGEKCARVFQKVVVNFLSLPPSLYTAALLGSKLFVQGKESDICIGNMILKRAKRDLDTIHLNIDEGHFDVLPTSKAIFMQMGYKGKLVFRVIRKK